MGEEGREGISSLVLHVHIPVPTCTCILASATRLDYQPQLLSRSHELGHVGRTGK